MDQSWGGVVGYWTVQQCCAPGPATKIDMVRRRGGGVIIHDKDNKGMPMTEREYRTGMEEETKGTPTDEGGRLWGRG